LCVCVYIYMHSIKASLKLRVCFHSVPAYQYVLIVEEIEARWQRVVEGYVGMEQPRGTHTSVGIAVSTPVESSHTFSEIAIV
jgi:hypothetical protein